jgi:helicase required for RNAi-mediated heterochromatin assembly 1
LQPISVGQPDSSQSLKEIEEHVNRKYELDTSITEYWRKLPEIPGAEEILQENTAVDNGYQFQGNKNTNLELPENIVDGCWDTKAQYIGAHYQLLREDAIAPLRNAVATYKADSRMNDDENISIYTHVGITYPILTIY